MQDKNIRTLVQGLILSLLPAGAALAGPVNLNSADAATLARELDGIGPAKAQAIVEFRQKNGPFRSPEDLLHADGIGRLVADGEAVIVVLERAPEHAQVHPLPTEVVARFERADHDAIQLVLAQRIVIRRLNGVIALNKYRSWR